MQIDKPINWSAMNLSEQTKTISFETDEEGNIKGMPVVVFDPFNIPTTGLYTGTFFPRGLVAIADGSNPAVTGPISTPTEDTRYNGLWVNAHMMVRTGDTAAGLPQNLRTPTTWKSIIGQTAGNTVWDPTAGTKFRLMGGIITISKEAACAGGFVINLLDAAVNIVSFQVSQAALVATGQVIVLPFNFPGNGYLSAAADNLLVTTVSGNLTAGAYAVSVWGTEE